MAAGVPVVASNTPAVAEAAGEAALLAPPTEVSAWRDALLSILNDHDNADRLRTAGLARSAEFSWKRCIDETFALYNKVAATGK
jgi:glycosyltransferase involved in cell wall biosynthesis